NFDARKTILSYDDVLREQREIIYKQRFEVIDSDEGAKEVIEQMLQSVINSTVDTHTADDDEGKWNLQGIVDYTVANLLFPEDITVNDLVNKEPEEMKAFISDKVNQRYTEKEEQLTEEQMREFEKVILLRT